jgi:fatty-acyl-CoA synthase
MSRPWYTHTAQQLLEKRAEEHPEKAAFVYAKDGAEHVTTFEELLNDANRAAAALGTHGVEAGDHVALHLVTLPEFITLTYGALQLGAVVNPYNAMWGREEFGAVAHRADPAVIVTMGEFGGKDYTEVVQSAIPDLEVTADGVSSDSIPTLEHVVTVGVDDAPDGPFSDYETFMQAGDDFDPDEWDRRRNDNDPDDCQFILQTSGTTGVSKSALLTHRSLVGNAHFIADALNFESSDRYINFSPFYHNGGLVTGLLMNTAVKGSTLYFQPQFDPAGALELIDEHEIESMFGFGTMYAALRDAPNYEETTFSIRKALVAATPAQYEQAVEMSDAPPEERAFSNLYAQTEAGPLVSVVDADDPDPELRKYSNGQPIPGMEVTVKDPKTGEQLPPGEAGELCFRGWSVFERYYKQPERTEEGRDEDGFWHSDDYGRMEGGYVYFDGRLDNVVKTGGENVSTREVETFLVDTFEEIAEASVLGVPDDYWGHRVVAFIEYEPGAERRSTDEWRRVCSDRIADYKVPKNFFEIDEWPVTDTGKIVQGELEDEALERISETEGGEGA